MPKGILRPSTKVIQELNVNYRTERVGASLKTKLILNYEIQFLLNKK